MAAESAYWAYAALFVAGAATAVASAPKAPRIPPSPVIPPEQVDQGAAAAEADARKRQQLAGGIASTVGTSGGEAGAVMNPATMSGHSLLGQ